jgi:hypothetical protein
MSYDNSFVMGNVMNDYQTRDPSGGPLAHLASTTGGMHSYSHEEVRAFSEYLNRSLKDDPDMKNDLPLNPQSGDLFRVAAKGVLLWYSFFFRLIVTSRFSRSCAVAPRRAHYKRMQTRMLCVVANISAEANCSTSCRRTSSIRANLQRETQTRSK